MIMPKNIFEGAVFPKGPNKMVLAERDSHSILRICIGAGGRIPPHVADHSAFFLVLKGRAIVTSGENEIELAANEFIALEPNQMRGIQALEDVVILGIRD